MILYDCTALSSLDCYPQSEIKCDENPRRCMFVPIKNQNLVNINPKPALFPFFFSSHDSLKFKVFPL